MAAAHIPATTLTYKGTYTELSAKLLERETGWCTDDNILYVKGENGLVPLSKVVVIDDSATLQSVHDYVSRGIIPMMKVAVVPGSPDLGDAYLALQHIDSERAVFARVFGSYVQYVSWSNGTWVPQQMPLGGISAVAHDESLAGDGTADDPLKVAQSGGSIRTVTKDVTAADLWEAVKAARAGAPETWASALQLYDAATEATLPFIMFVPDPFSTSPRYWAIFSAPAGDAIYTEVATILVDPDADAGTEVVWNPWYRDVGAVYTIAMAESAQRVWEVYNASVRSYNALELQDADASTGMLQKYMLTSSTYDEATHAQILSFATIIGPTLYTKTATLTLSEDEEAATAIAWAQDSITIPPALPDAPENGLAYFRKDGEWATAGDLATATGDEIAYGEIAVQVPPSASGTVTIAGKQYRTVVIGNQEWLAENLDAEIGTLGSDCFMYYDDPEMRAKYGLLYKWATLCSGSDTPTEALAAILPAGWRLPSGPDFTTLFESVGGRDVAGTKLKTTSGWPVGTNGTDDFGFSGLPSGRLVRYSYYEEGTVGYLWTSFNGVGPHYVYLSPYAEVYSANATSESNAFAVRLVRDYVPSAPRTVKATVQEIVKAGTDSELSATSENPVQNKVIYEAIGNVEALLAAL